ncbi:MAG: protoporphyrinogen oxidase [Acidobacteriota bacterium]
MTETRKRIAVIGGGITGLSAAFYLELAARDLGLDLEVSVFEQSTRWGGVIGTIRRNGFLLETGPEGWASYKPSPRYILRELGREEEVIGSRDEYRRTLLLSGGRLRELPDGMMFLAPIEPLAFWRSAPLSWRGKLRASLEPLIPRSRGDLSVHRFFARRLGEEFAETLAEPLISGVLGFDYRRLSAPSSLPELYRAEQRAGSLWRGLRRFAGISRTYSVLHTLRGGMEELVAAIRSSLQGVRLLAGTPVRRLRRSGSEWIIGADGEDTAFDLVFLCTSAWAAAEILQELLPEAAGELRRIPYSPSRLAFLAYRKADFPFGDNLFGFVVSQQEPVQISACTWASTKFPGRAPDDVILLRCSLRNLEDPEGLALDPAVAAHADLQKILKFQADPLFTFSWQHERALPRLLVGHGRRLERIRAQLRDFPTLELLGSYVGGVGVPDCVMTARQAVERWVRTWTGEDWSRVPRRPASR